jgi:biopolymer transport protein ExbD
MRRRRSVSKVTAQMNVTSLLDITFVLLITFMIVAPALRHGVELDLPKVREAPGLKQDKPAALVVRHSLVGMDLELDGQVVSLDNLTPHLRAEAAKFEKYSLTISGDRRVQWEQMAQVITAIRNAGVDNIGILTLPMTEVAGRGS